ncbi:hypothetical protein K435DRAFT_661483, partial [Dendrothele bispora CBS 962.96]
MSLLPWQRSALSVVERFTLNEKQELAFLLCVSRRMDRSNTSPFQLIIGGPGGTGKSHIYEALKTFYREHGIDYELAFTAPMGIAASNIGASTTASFLALRTSYENLKSKRGVSLDGIRKRLENVRTIIIDEFYFLGCEDFQRITKHL